MSLSEFTRELEYMVRARYSAIYIATFEEERAIQIVSAIGQSLNKRIIIWSTTRGFIMNDQALDITSINLKTAIDIAEEMATVPTLFIWCDIHSYFSTHNDPLYIRRFREFSRKIRTAGLPSNSIIVSPLIEIPVELQKEITLIDLPLPNREEVERIISDFIKPYQGRDDVEVDCSKESIDVLARASLGLLQPEIENCLAKSLVKSHRISRQDVGLILEEKRQIIRKLGTLEYVNTDHFNLDKVGGLQNLKQWLEMRKTAYTGEAKAFGIDWPRGVLLVGVPGCGKSLSAKCVAAAWQMPLIRLDMGRIFSQFVGSSEANLRTALNLCETVSPAIVWIDEIEKGISGIGGGQADGGTATRLFGYLLTWMQEKKSPVFVIATANKIDDIPPELLRKGRFDEIFFVDLPTREEQREIFTIQIKGVNRDPSRFDLDKLVELAGETHWGEGIRLTGSEIEAVVKEGLLESFYLRSQGNEPTRDLETADIVKAVQRMIPLARIRHQEIDRLRKWADENAVHASALPGEVKEKESGR